MSNQELKKHLDSGADSPLPNISVKEKKNDSHQNRAVVAIDDYGFRCDKTGEVQEYLSGHLLDPTTHDRNGAPTRINIRYKSAEESAREQSGGGPESAARASTYFKNLAAHTQSYGNRTPLSAIGSMIHEDVVIAADRLRIDESEILKDEDDPKAVPGKYMTAGIHYAQIMASLNSEQDTEVKISYATKGFSPPKPNLETGDPGRDIAFVKEIIDGIDVHLMTPDDARASKQQKDIVEFIRRSLSNKLPPHTTKFPEDARRTGFVVIGGGFHKKDENGKRVIDNRPDIYTELYADRVPKGKHFNARTGKETTVWEAGDPLKTLTKLVEGRDRNTLDYLKNPSNPALERKALDADYQRAILHAISHREAKRGDQLAIASQSEENIAKIREVYDEARAGNFQLRATSGERREYFLKAGREEADKGRAVYNKFNPDNPTFRNPMTKPHVSEFNMADHIAKPNRVTGRLETRPSGVAVPMIMGIKSIDDPNLTQAPGSKLIQRIAAVDLDGLSARTPTFDPTNPNMKLLRKYKDATYTLGAGHSQMYLNEAVEQHHKDHPLYPTPSEARAAYEKEQALGAEKTTKNLIGVSAGDTMRTLDGHIAVPVADDVFANLLNASLNTAAEEDTAAKLAAAAKAAEEKRIKVSELAKQLQAELENPEPELEMVVDDKPALDAKPAPAELTAEAEKPKAKTKAAAKPKAKPKATATKEDEKPAPAKRTRKAAVKADPAETKPKADTEKPSAAEKPTAAKPAKKTAAKPVEATPTESTEPKAEAAPAKRKRRKP